jgi:hypothetical protein
LEKQKQLFCSKTLTTISVQYSAFDVEWSKLKSNGTLFFTSVSTDCRMARVSTVQGAFRV